MTKKAKETKPESFEWICNNCKSVHVEKYEYTKVEKNKIKLTCTCCGQVRPVKLIELPEEELANNWVSMKCHKCEERLECFENNNQKLFKKKSKLIARLGFCEDYTVDHSQLTTDKKQVCHEEVTFNSLFNRGIFPTDKGKLL
jgi:hypothetical protein